MSGRTSRFGSVWSACLEPSLSCECEPADLVCALGVLDPCTTVKYTSLNVTGATTANIMSSTLVVAASESVSLPSGPGTI